MSEIVKRETVDVIFDSADAKDYLGLGSALVIPIGSMILFANFMAGKRSNRALSGVVMLNAVYKAMEAYVKSDAVSNLLEDAIDDHGFKAGVKLHYALIKEEVYDEWGEVVTIGKWILEDYDTIKPHFY